MIKLTHFQIKKITEINEIPLFLMLKIREIPLLMDTLAALLIHKDICSGVCSYTVFWSNILPFTNNKCIYLKLLQTYVSKREVLDIKYTKNVKKYQITRKNPRMQKSRHIKCSWLKFCMISNKLFFSSYFFILLSYGHSIFT